MQVDGPFVFPQEFLRTTLMVSLLSVWVLIGLFSYLNHYTKRNYFTIWTAAWLFYALWLTLNLREPDIQPGDVIFVFKQWCVAISATFLLWGSLRFLSLPIRQMSFGLFIVFLLAWAYVSPQVMDNVMAIQLPLFILEGLGSVFAGMCFFRLRRKMPFVGAGMLSLGFLLWGLYLCTYPISQTYHLSSAGFFLAGLLQLFIAVSMIVLVLEEAQYNADKIRAEIAAVRSEKDALQAQALTAEEKYRSLYDQVRLTEGVQQAYEELRRTHQMVVQQERLRALGEMASGVAHDINNALSPIVAYSELVLNKFPTLPEEARQHVHAIYRSGNDISHIVARMREFYRRQPDTERLTQVDCNRLIEEVIELTRPRWRDVSQREGVSIHIQQEFELGLPMLLSEPADLREALINLVFNAVDALPKGGTITLATRSITTTASENDEAKHMVQVEVRDNGVGMDEATRARCLEPFFSTKIQRGGSGLGLAMVYGMMQRHEGSIEVASSPGKGTSIKLTFPIREGGLPAIPANARPSRQPRSLRVLCIDDELQIRELLNDCLTHFNHHVTLAAGGKEGLELFRGAKSQEQPFDAIITDLGMPDMDGHQVARSVKAESPQTVVIMMTGWGAMMKEDGETDPETDALVGKPPHIHELNALLLNLTAPKTSN
jgi:signal transduction histidine kinase/CheY-like chemotaxis protein